MKASLLDAKPGRPVTALVIASANSCAAMRPLPEKAWLNMSAPVFLFDQMPDSHPASLASPVAR